MSKNNNVTTFEERKSIIEKCGNFNVVERYINKKRYESLVIRHNLCKIEFITNYHSFIKNNIECPHCNPNKRATYTHKSAEQIFKDNGCLLLTEFRKQKDDLFYKCNCGNIAKTQLHIFLKGHRCNVCAEEKRVQKTKGQKRPNSSKEKNPNWKGGISDLKDILRNSLKRWSFESLKQYNFKCAITNENGTKKNKLIVHHLVSFNQIVDEMFEVVKYPRYKKVEDYCEYQINSMIYVTKHLHKKYGYGIPLLPNIHNLFHKHYGFGDNTPDQFSEFKNRYFSGEFNNKIINNAQVYN